jgi:drug/metabolite transporter (DMT)-like permease
LTRAKPATGSTAGWVLACIAMAAFAANSLLCRGALGSRGIDPATFTSVRLVSGALTLWLLVRIRGSRPTGGSFGSAAALFAYAILFSFAYLKVHAGVGALTLFACVQVTMIGAGLLRGERLRGREWAGLSLALAGLAALTLRGAGAPDALSLAMMAFGGVAWGIYSLRGRGAENPLAVTADNFVRSVPLALGASLLALSGFHVSARGLLMAAASGALASGLGYSIWYAALAHLSAGRAAIVQLSVPALAALGGVVFLSEPLSPRLVISGAVVLGGVALALGAKPTQR